MSIRHAASGELVDVRPLWPDLSRTSSSTLVRAAHLKVFRLVLPAGKAAPDHEVDGSLTIQCLEGAAELKAHGRTQVLRAGYMVCLSDSEPHAVKALEDTSLLVTILFRRL
jgi:quercetin dioxygenase-like cupin family protein